MKDKEIIKEDVKRTTPFKSHMMMNEVTENNEIPQTLDQHNTKSPEISQLLYTNGGPELGYT